MILFRLLLALTFGIGDGPVGSAAAEPLLVDDPAASCGLFAGGPTASLLLGEPAASAELPVGDLRADPMGRLWLGRYLGGTNWERFGEGGIEAYSNTAYRADAERAARAAVAALPEITAALGVSPGDILPFWILVSPRAEGFAREAPTWSAAMAQPENRLVVLSGPSLRRTVMDLDETVAHEMAHLALRARIGEMGWVPRWFDEGLAMRLSGYSRWSDRLAGIGRGRLDLHELTDFFPRDPGLARQAYVESEAAVRRMQERGPLVPLLDRLAAGADFEPAFAAVYGQSFDDFAREIADEVPAVWRFLATVRGTTLLWAFGAALVVLGAWRVRLRNRRRLREWEAAESDVQGVGPPPVGNVGSASVADVTPPPVANVETPEDRKEDRDIRSV